MKSTVFSSTVFNAQRYFAELLKHVTASDLPQCMAEKEKQSLCNFVAGELTDPSGVISEALRPLVQTAATLDRSLGLEALKNIANSSHEMASHASGVLARQMSLGGS